MDSSPNNLQETSKNPQQASLKNKQTETPIENNCIPSIDSDVIFQLQNSSSSNINLQSMLSFKKTPSSDFHLNTFLNDSSFIKNNGSLEQFSAEQKISKDHIFPPEINIDSYFEDLYRREIEVSKSATKEECLSILEPYSIEHYATTHFRKQPGVLVFSQKGIKKLTTFSDKPFHHPLLQNTPLSKKSVVEKLETYILLYIGVKRDLIQEMYYRYRKEDQKTLLFLAIIYILHNDESLVNECFMHIMKAMRDVPTQEALLLSWKLFLTIASLFYVSDWGVKNVIRWFIVDRMFYDNILGKYARYSLICFHDRSILGRSIDSRTTRKDIIDVPLGLQDGKKTFKCSLYTQMWDQRKKFPKLPIPQAIYLVIKTLIRDGVMITPKPFPYIKTPTLMQRSISTNSKNKTDQNVVKSNENAEDKKEEINEIENKKSKEEIKNSKDNEKEVIKNNNKKDEKASEYSYEEDEEEEEEEEEAEESVDEEKDKNNNDKSNDKNKSIEKDDIITKSKEFYSTTVEEDEEEEEEEEESSGDDYDYDTIESTTRRNRLKKSNMKLLCRWSEEIFENEDVIDDGEINDLMGFLLMWMHNLIDPIVPKCMANNFIETFSQEKISKNDFNDFIDDLPLLHKNTLKYIIGFFREISQNEHFTQMSNQSIADGFASYFVCTSFTTVDPFTRQKMTDIAPRFILYCLENLDVTDMYPLNPSYEVRNKA